MTITATSRLPTDGKHGDALGGFAGGLHEQPDDPQPKGEEDHFQNLKLAR
jgi:hypothetical protein